MNNKTYKEVLIKRTHDFGLGVIKMLKKAPQRDFASQVMARQLIRSATSIGANIVEAQASPTRKDFSNFINHALKSANESRYWLGLMCDSSEGDITGMTFVLQEALELSK